MDNNETLAAHGYLNYNGDLTGMEHPQVLGPNLNGERIYTVSVEYDAEKNLSRVGYRFDFDRIREVKR